MLALTRKPEFARPKQSGLTKAFEKCTLYDGTSEHWNKVTDTVMLYLAMNMIPIKSMGN